ncbi:hypothetical protein AV274_5952 [Blastocystis sp. ATCC 50177/Nand II]|uniref:GOLD domain-containing protein n=1 Tax=Blastocystis sp. subtype 1 (strain ATCC 50177 / NandII) TaxID=478820 RepID=A0A196S8L3_BLAHN|nr:hypothetical protein AV274_5952 [Blastocystis sp. ATCC 50177/Nand II]
MMKWSLDQLAGLSAITNQFGGVDDPDLSLLLDRIKGLEDAYDHIEKACGDVQEFSLTMVDSIRSMSLSLQALGTADPKSEEACMFGAHVRNLDMEYGKWVKAKLDIEVEDFMVNELKEKRNSLSDLRQRINSCSRSSSSFQEMQLQVNQMKKEGAVDAGVMEEYEKLKIVVDQQKLQLQSDVHFIIERDTPFVEHAFDIVQGMMQRSIAHNSALLTQEPPKFLVHPEAPFVEGKEDSEIDFTVSPNGFHILPLSIKKGKEIFWAITTFGSEIYFRLLFKDEKMAENVILPAQRICSTTTPVLGSYTGTESGMLEMLFDNSNALFRSKRIHLRLGVKDCE